MTTRKLQAKPLTRSFEIRKDSVLIDSNEIEFIFSTGAQVTRSPWYSEPYIEELSLDPSHVRLSRLNNNAPLLNTHNSSSLDDVLGVIVKGSAKTDGKIGTARARMSERESIAPIVQDVKNGILNHTSVGYRVYTYRDITQAGDKMQRLLAVDWEPFEVSLVPVGADDLATTRSDSFEINACEIILKEEEKRMGDENKTVSAQPEIVADKKQIETAYKEGVAAEKQRVLEISDSCVRAGLDEDFKKSLIDGNVKLDEARKLIIDKIAEKQDATKKITAQHVTLGDNLSKRSFIDGASEAILHRAKPDKNQITELGMKFRRMSLIELVRFEMEKVRGKDSWAMSKDELVRSALSSTSDFPEILSNVANKSLMQGYKYMGQTFEPFVVRRPVGDFKEGKMTQIGEFPSLVQKNEAGEFKAGSISEGAEAFQLVSYGRDFNLTREVIINDDLNVFTDIPYKAGIACNMLEADLVYAQLTSNPTMADSIALFHASHGNLMTATAIDVDNLGTAKSAMRVQTGLDGSSPLNLEPAILLVPTAKETKAEQYVTVLGQSQLFADASGSRNPHIGRFQVVSDPRLDTSSTTAWYLVANKNQIDTIMLGYLEGQENGPVLSITEEAGVGFKYRVYADRVAKVLDYRGFVKNPGA